MKLVIDTQYQENYAAHDESYVHGIDTPHWKFKGGSQYIFPNCDPNKAEEIAEFVKPFISYSNPASKEYVLGWSAQDDAYLTDNQKMIKEYDTGGTKYLDPEIWIKDGKVFKERGFIVGEFNEEHAGEMHLWHDELFEDGTSKCIGYFIDGVEASLEGAK